MLTISLLTPFTLQQDDQPLALTSRRTEALFVYLLRSGQPQAREVLANLFWDDLPQTQAAGNLRVLIANLHKAVGPYVTITRQSIAFDPKSAFRCDLTVLEQGLAAARSTQASAGGLSQASADTLAHTLAGYQGGFLPGFYLRGGQGFDEWLATEREWLWTRAIAALSDLTGAYLRLGDYRAGIAQAQRLVKFDPLREEGHQQLMQLLAADGQTNAALAHYQRCVHLFDQELGVPPSRATTELFEQIQRGAWQKPALPATVHLSVPAPPHNLPRAMTPFVGREAELERLRPYLLDPTYPLVTLVGEGGSGKTHLALVVARQLLTQEPPPFPDGIWLVPLATLQHSDTGLRTAIAAAIGKALGFTFQGQRPIAEQLLALLQKRRGLLLLDNFEQLIPPETVSESGAVDFVIELLEQAPQLQLLITSRTPLDLSSEFVVRLGGLPVPAADLPTDAATYASVRLFAERATRIAERFHLARQVSEVAAICRFVAGLPLGIELAAAWSGSLSPLEIVLALQANLDFLATRRRDIPPRQRSMRAVFAHSWQLLTPTAQRVLAQIACFHGGFTRAAAQMVLVVATIKTGDQQDLTKILDYLVHRALLQQDETGRYSLHTLLREYASEKLVELSRENDETKGVAQRHSRYYLDLADQANSQGWYTRADLAPIHADLDNVRQGWQWASLQHDLDRLAQGWRGLWHFYHSSALFQEGEEVFRATLELLQATDSNQTQTTPESAQIPGLLPGMVARLQVAHASFLNALGHYAEAVTLAQSATAFAEATQDEALKAQVYAAWGTGLYRQAQVPAALARLERGLTAAQTAGLPLVEANLHKRLANALQTNHDFAHARQHYAQALALYRQLHHLPGEGDVLNALGWCSLQQHQLAEALTDLRQAQQIQQAIDDPHGLSMTLINLAIIYERRDEYDQAFACRRQALDLLQQFDDPYQAALVNHGLGLLLSRLGDYAAAEPYYQRALEIDRGLGDPGGVAWTQNNLGLLYNHRGEYAAAKALHEEALQTSIALGATTTQGLAWSRLGQDHYGLGNFEEAYDAYLHAIAIQQQLQQQVWLIEAKSGLAATQLALRMEDEALALVHEILAFLAEHPLAGAREPMLVYWNCYQVLHARSDARAEAVLRTANQQLTEQAARLNDPQLQHAFLEKVRPHYALRQAYDHDYGSSR